MKWQDSEPYLVGKCANKAASQVMHDWTFLDIKHKVETIWALRFTVSTTRGKF